MSQSSAHSHSHPHRHLAAPLVQAQLLCLAAAGPAHAIDLTRQPGASASANSCYLNPTCAADADWSPAKVIDGLEYDLTGRYAWSAGDHGTAAEPNWVRVDLGSLATLSAVDLHFSYNRGAWAGYTNEFQLLASADGSSWQTLGSGTLVDDAVLSQRLFSWDAAAPGAPLARFVEYRVTGGTHWSALSEITVQGVPSAVPELGSGELLAGGLALLGAAGALRRRQHPA